MAETMLLTVRESAENVALVAPANTITDRNTVSGSVADNATLAPPAGAAADRVTVPMTVVPPATLEDANVSDASAARPTTVSAGDWLLLPLIDAVIVVVPGATAVMVNVALADPAGTVKVGGTVATAALLLAKVRFAPPAGAAALSVTVPCPLVPAITLVAPSETADTALVVVGEVDDPPHCVVLRILMTAASSGTNAARASMVCLMAAEVSTTVPAGRFAQYGSETYLCRTARGPAV